MHRFLFIITIVITSFAKAQTKLPYTAILEGGTLHGQNGNSHTISLSGGIMYKNIMLGLGATTDNYFYRSVPVFAEVRKSFGKRRVQPFITGSAGINFPHLTSGEKEQFNGYSNRHIDDGFYGKTATGVSYRFCRHLRLFGSFGCSYKTTKVTYDSQVYYPQGPTSTTTTSYRMSRLCFAIGLWY